MNYLFPDGTGVPCATGAELLQTFIARRPDDLGFLEPGDINSLSGSGFAGIPEWDEFVHHYSVCERCHE